MKIENAKEFFPTLESLRGVAALLVVIFHVNVKWNTHVHSWDFVRNSYLFVDFFFVLSGFVISHHYSEKLVTLKGVATFIRLRFWRLYPLHLVTLIAFATFVCVKMLVARKLGIEWIDTDENTTFSFLTNLTLVHSLGLHHTLTFNAPSWSISVEFFTYVVFAFVILLSLHRKNVVRCSLFLCTTTAIILFSVDNRRFFELTYDYGFPRCIFGFFVGILVQKFSSHIRRPPYGGTLGIGGNLAEIAVLFSTVLVVSFVKTHVLLPFISVLVFGLVILIFSFPSSTLVSRALQNKVPLHLGKISYSIYLWHWVVVSCVSGILSGLGRVPKGSDTHGEYAAISPIFGDMLMIVTLLLIIAISSLSYPLIEKKYRDWSRATNLHSTTSVKLLTLS